MNDLTERIKQAQALGTGLMLNKDDVRKLKVNAHSADSLEQRYADEHGKWLAWNSDGTCYSYPVKPEPRSEGSWVIVNDADSYGIKWLPQFCRPYPYPLEGWAKSLITPRKQLKKNTPLQQVIDKYGARRLVVAGWCQMKDCDECEVEDNCPIDRCEWKNVPKDVINTAYEEIIREEEK